MIVKQIPSIWKGTSWELEWEHDLNVQNSSGSFIQICPYWPKIYDT